MLAHPARQSSCIGMRSPPVPADQMLGFISTIGSVRLVNRLSPAPVSSKRVPFRTRKCAVGYYSTGHDAGDSEPGPLWK
jgi:hypothetical protein